MNIDRRRALALLGLGAATPANAVPPVPPYSGGVSFRHGVASGDPTPAGAIVWTRITPQADAGQNVVPVTLEVAEDAAFARIVHRGAVGTDAGRDFTVKIDVGGLRPGADYLYRFRSGAAVSPVGRFRTLPERTEDVVFAVVSCALHPGGLFNAYDAIGKLERVDAVVHLGDYIYEYGAADADYGMAAGRRLGRIPEPPTEIVSLADYRLRHAQYKSDPDLQAAHARAAWITVWDDHETTNDSWLDGAQNHQPESEGQWAVRKAAALKAYYEWMPIREPAAGRSADMIARTFRFGDVATLHMTETRLTARGRQLSYERDIPMRDGRPDLEAFQAALTAPDRTLMGPAQLAELGRTVGESVRAGVVWQVLGNQIVMGRVNGPNMVEAFGAERVEALTAAADPAVRGRLERLTRLFSAARIPYNLDAWDGYPAERERVYAVLKGAGARPIVLAGDSHAFWVNELRDAAGARVGAEFGTTAVSSPSLGDALSGLDVGEAFAAQNEEVVFSDQANKGFTLLRLTRQEAVGDLVAVSTTQAKPYDTRVVKRFRVTPEGPGLSAPQPV
jgi:alkaline phosphatase D